MGLVFRLVHLDDSKMGIPGAVQSFRTVFAEQLYNSPDPVRVYRNNHAMPLGTLHRLAMPIPLDTIEKRTQKCQLPRILLGFGTRRTQNKSDKDDS